MNIHSRRTVGHVYGITTMYQPKAGMRCCDNCQPQLFPVEHVTSSRIQQGLKRGKKKAVPEAESKYITETLKIWRDGTLMEKVYPGLTTFSASTLLSNDVIDKLAKSGEELREYSQLRRYALWARGHDIHTGGPNELGELLMAKLAEIYDTLNTHRAEDEESERRKQRAAGEIEYYINTVSNWEVMTPEDFSNG
jgi:cytochrome c553